MTQEPAWSPEEFELVLAFPNLGDAELSRLIKTRSEGAVAAVRAGVCEYHQGNTGAHGMLSQMMRARLDAHPRTFACHLCGVDV